MPKSDYLIRPSRPADGDRTVEIWRSAVDATHHFLDPADRAAIDRESARYIRTLPLLLAADADDRPLAFAIVTPGRLEALFADPEHHGRGLGRALVAHAAALHPTLDTEVNAQNPGALAFYRRVGFVETGASPLDDQGRPYPLIRLRRDAAGGVLIRLARDADIPALAEVERSAAGAFRATPHAWVADDGVTEADAYPPMIQRHALWVAQSGEAPVGFVSAAEQADALHLLELAVHAGHQRRGVGRRLVQAAIGAARARGLPAVTLTTFEDVAFNAPFYRTLGFRTLERPPPRLRAILQAEAAHGLTQRCAMRLDLNRGAVG